MIDIKFLRENPDVVRENIKKKFQDAKLPLVDEVLELLIDLEASDEQLDCPFVFASAKTGVAILELDEKISAVNIEISTIEKQTKDEIYKTSVSLSSLEDKLNPEEFMRCHKSYIVHLDKISKIEPYGRWTYVVKFKGSNETALMTAENYDEIRKKFQ